MTDNQIQKETEYLLSAAIQKCGNLADAQDITQETILSALVYLSKGGTVTNMRAFLTTLMNRKYYDLLRRKYRIPTVFCEERDFFDETDFTAALIDSEESENIRAEVAFLADSYRSVIVNRYFYNKSIKDIADELNLPAGTVKSRLNLGRKQIRKGVEKMEKYSENSYMPKYLKVRNSGQCGLNEEPMSLTEGDLLAQNLLILAYDKPLSISELSKAIGVAAAYVEPVINKLIKGELMKGTGDGRVYTDFIIYQADDYVKYIHQAEAFAESHIYDYILPLETAVVQLKNTSFYSKRLERFMMIEIAENGLYSGMEPLRKKRQIFPDRPNGGKWIAFATVCPENYSIPEDKRGKEEYMLSGMRCTVIDRYLDADDLKLYNYETSLDPTGWRKHQGYGFDLFQDVENNMLKLFYLIKKNIRPESVDLDPRIIKGMPLLEERGFITSKSNLPEVLIPVLNHKEEKEFFNICGNAAKAFGKNISKDLAEYCRTHRKKIPSHLKSVPDQKLTMPYEPSPMMFVYEAINKGIHPRDLGCVCPETIAVFD